MALLAVLLSVGTSYPNFGNDFRPTSTKYVQLLSLQVVTAQTENYCASGNLAWTFLYPGYYVYQWEDKVIKNKLDCSKLVPCSESLKTIAIDEHFSPARCQVISLRIHDQKLYVGTSWGCLIITEAETLRPITVFRPYSDEMQAIVSVNFKGNSLIATLGKGYRGLIERYVNVIDNDADEDHDSGMLYAILWKPDDWLTD